MLHVQEQSQNYQQLSRDLSQLRKFYWEQGINALTDNQKKMVAREVENIFTKELPALKKEGNHEK